MERREKLKSELVKRRGSKVEPRHGLNSTDHTDSVVARRIPDPWLWIWLRFAWYPRHHYHHCSNSLVARAALNRKRQSLLERATMPVLATPPLVSRYTLQLKNWVSR